MTLWWCTIQTTSGRACVPFEFANWLKSRIQPARASSYWDAIFSVLTIPETRRSPSSSSLHQAQKLRLAFSATHLVARDPPTAISLFRAPLRANLCAGCNLQLRTPQIHILPTENDYVAIMFSPGPSLIIQSECEIRAMGTLTVIIECRRGTGVWVAITWSSTY